jgi:hypothetical protein
MATKHTVTDSKGQTHKRVSQNRVYAFAVVYHRSEQTGRDGRVWPAFSDAKWCSRRDLAEKEAAVWRRCGDEVEIIEVQS